jgi:S-DNA-T family DNA segregation ATPase FtsK/SpoIIIE
LNKNVLNWGGRVGAWIADILLLLLGLVAYFFPVLMVVSSWLGLREHDPVPQKNREWIAKSIGWLFVVGSSAGLMSFYVTSPHGLPPHSGGIVGDLLSSAL